MANSPSDTSEFPVSQCDESGDILSSTSGDLFGHYESVCVVANGISYSVPSPSVGCCFLSSTFRFSPIPFRPILRQVGLWAPAGRLIAIMGPSGSGKTTLLNALAGRLDRSFSAHFPFVSCRRRRRPQLKGEVLYNNEHLSAENVRNVCSYVMQEDHVLDGLTVHETMQYRARLVMKGSSNSERETRVNQILDALSLVHCRNSVVGGGLQKGISGGERKRMAIGMELLSDPSVLFLDEPTSGLDSALAYDVVKLLVRIARSGCTVICTVHQPRSQMFDLFDSVVLLSKGQVVYHGEASASLDYFERLGYVCPPRYNPADFLLDLLTPKNNFLSIPVSGKHQKRASKTVEPPMVGNHKTRPRGASKEEEGQPADEHICSLSLYPNKTKGYANSCVKCVEYASTSPTCRNDFMPGGRMCLIQSDIDRLAARYLDSAEAKVVRSCFEAHLCKALEGRQLDQWERRGIWRKGDTRGAISPVVGINQGRSSITETFTWGRSPRPTDSRGNCDLSCRTAVNMSESFALESVYDNHCTNKGKNLEENIIFSPSSLEPVAQEDENIVKPFTPSLELYDLPLPQVHRQFRDSCVSQWFKAVWVICSRSFVNSQRHHQNSLLGMSLIFTVLGCILGGVWFQLRGAEDHPTDMFGSFLSGGVEGVTNDAKKMASDFRNICGGILFVACFFASASFAAIVTFQNERKLYVRECAAGIYSPSAFFVGKTLADFPLQHIPATIFLVIFYWMSGMAPTARQFCIFLLIGHLTVFAACGFFYMLSTAVPEGSLVYALAPICLIIFMLLSGFYINPADLPSWISWLQWISFIKHSFVGMSVNQLPPDENFGMMKSEQLLEVLGIPIPHQDLWRSAILLFALGIVQRLFALMFLTSFRSGASAQV